MPRLFAVVRVRGAAWQAGLSMREQALWFEHAAFMNALVGRGFIVRGGPLGDGERVLLIVEAESESAIRTRFALDPWEIGPLLRTDSVEPWTVLLDRDSPSQPQTD